LSPVPACGTFLQCCSCLNRIEIFKGKKKRDIAVQKNNLHEEVEQQQDRGLVAKIDR
jgi:hypothetical protein